MEKLTGDYISSVLATTDTRIDSFLFDEFDADYDDYVEEDDNEDDWDTSNYDKFVEGRKKALVDALGEYEVVSRTGGPDKGSYAEFVLYYSDYKQYFSISGYYSSYGGYDFSDSSFSEVVPKTIEVIKYVKIS